MKAAGLRWIALAAPFALGGCILPSADYSDELWQDYVSDARCNPAADPSQHSDVPYYLVTSRLPDCRNAAVTLTVQRADRIRFGRYARPPAGGRGQGSRNSSDMFVPLAFDDPGRWWAAIERDARDHGGRVLLYVHGYNEAFSVTAEDAADMGEFSGFPGPVIHYSWPSRGALLGYAIDENNADFNRIYFSGLVEHLARLEGVREIVLVAHSMGARLAISAIEDVDTLHPPEISAKLKTIVLASPDYDRQAFAQKARDSLLTPARAARGRTVTIYVSARDTPVGISRRLHGYARLGSPHCDGPVREGGNGRCYLDIRHQDGSPISGLFIVDTTGTSDSSRGHNDFLRAPPGCADFTHVVRGDAIWEGRVRIESPYVWSLDPAADTSACRTALPEAE